jgi:hypothetical protein
MSWWLAVGSAKPMMVIPIPAYHRLKASRVENSVFPSALRYLNLAESCKSKSAFGSNEYPNSTPGVMQNKVLDAMVLY